MTTNETPRLAPGREGFLKTTDKTILTETIPAQKPIIRSSVRTDIANFLRGLQTVCDELLASSNPAVIDAGISLLEGAPARLRQILQLAPKGGRE